MLVDWHSLLVSSDQLSELRRETNVEWTQALKGFAGDNQGSVKALSAQEELALVQHYSLKVRDLATAFGVQGTAIFYFKRFFLTNSVMRYAVVDVMHACVALARCVEEMSEWHLAVLKRMPLNQRAETCRHALASRPDMLTVLTSLGFDFTNRNVFVVLKWLFTTGGTAHQAFGCRTGAVHRASRQYVRNALLTDAPLVFDPHVMALSGIAVAAQRAGLDSELMTFLKHVIETTYCPYAHICMETVWSSTLEVQGVITTSQPDHCIASDSQYVRYLVEKADQCISSLDLIDTEMSIVQRQSSTLVSSRRSKQVEPLAEQ